ncbi:MAG: ATP-binding cassette domain-containing protein, partial [bacterium]|nr:ATP-binding cassette domain-containing protein [bacterium]
MTPEILSVNNLNRVFPLRRSWFGGKRHSVYAVTDVSLGIKKGQTVGIVGESGCGKSTLAKMIVMLDRPTAGSIRFQGQELRDFRGKEKKQFRSKVQFVFQDPLSSLNPRKTIRQILDTPLKHLTDKSPQERRQRVEELMSLVNLRPEFLERHPHEFSGGQSQRIGVARSIAASPELVVLDEPVSALDVSVQAQVLNLLRELKASQNLTYIFISHDLAVVENICNVVAVMYLGRIVEIGPRDKLFAAPRHPYTHILLSSVPVPGEKPEDRTKPAGEPPSPTALPLGCPFEPRCPKAHARCREKNPELEEYETAHLVA